jgi:hypothetical protein
LTLVDDARTTLALIALRVRLPILVRVQPLDRVVARATRGGALRAADPTIERVERAISRARVVPDTCLYRALARFAVLRRSGRDVRFVMGVKDDGNDLTGHAWIEEDGAPLGEALDADYSITYAHPRTP